VHDGYVRIGSSRVTRWQLLVVVFLGCYVLGTLWFFSRGELRFDGPGGARGRGGGQVGGLDELPGDGLSSGGGGGGGGGLGASGRDGVVQRELALLRSELKNAQAQVRRLTATAAAGGGGGGGGMGSAVALVPLATETDPDSLQEEKEEREALMDEIDEEAEQFGTCVGVLAPRTPSTTCCRGELSESVIGSGTKRRSLTRGAHLAFSSRPTPTTCPIAHSIHTGCAYPLTSPIPSTLRSSPTLFAPPPHFVKTHHFPPRLTTQLYTRY
jgi:hypothetical protein